MKNEEIKVKFTEKVLPAIKKSAKVIAVVGVGLIIGGLILTYEKPTDEELAQWEAEESEDFDTGIIETETE